MARDNLNSLALPPSWSRHGGLHKTIIIITVYFCFLDILPVYCLPPFTFFFRSKNTYSCLSLPAFCLFAWMLRIGVKHRRWRHRRFFLMDLFTTAASITAFVVVIKFLLPRPRIIIAGSHLALVNHLLFPPGFLQLQLRTSFLTVVRSCASLNTFGSYFISGHNGLKSGSLVRKMSK